MPTGVAPVGLEEQVVSCEVEQSEKAVLCCPSPVRRVPGVEETEAVVWHPVRGCQTGVGEHSWIVLRSEPVGVIERACLEQDSDGHRPIASGNFEAPVTIDQLVVPEIRLDFVAIVASRISLERERPDTIGRVPARDHQPHARRFPRSRPDDAPVRVKSAGAPKVLESLAFLAATRRPSSSRTASGLGAGSISGSLKNLAISLCARDRKSTRLNSCHVAISYAVFCLK